jgi:hypothetical protein
MLITVYQTARRHGACNDGSSGVRVRGLNLGWEISSRGKCRGFASVPQADCGLLPQLDYDPRKLL